MAILEFKFKVVCGLCHQSVDFIVHDGIKPIEEIAIAPCESCQKTRDNKIRQDMYQELGNQLSIIYKTIL